MTQSSNWARPKPLNLFEHFKLCKRLHKQGVIYEI